MWCVWSTNTWYNVLFTRLHKIICDVIIKQQRTVAYISWNIFKVTQIFGQQIVVWIRCFLYWSMPWIFDERECPVGSILSYSTGEVLGETSSPGQDNKIASWHDHGEIERESMLMQEIFKSLHQAVQSQNRGWRETCERIAWASLVQNILRTLGWNYETINSTSQKVWQERHKLNQSPFVAVKTSEKLLEKSVVLCL